MPSVGYSSRFFGRTHAGKAFSGVFAAIATSPPGPPPDPYFGLCGLYLMFPWPNACRQGIFRCFCCNRHFSSPTPTGPVLCPPWAIAHVSLAERMLARHFQAFLLQSPLLLPDPPPDPYFGLRGLYLTFPWPNACRQGIFRCFCCNRHFSSRTPTGPVLCPPWAIAHISLAERMPARHFQVFLLESPLLVPDPHRTRTYFGLRGLYLTFPWPTLACALMTRHGCHVFHFS